jgi:hypothetical protein
MGTHLGFSFVAAILLTTPVNMQASNEPPVVKKPLIKSESQPVKGHCLVTEKVYFNCAVGRAKKSKGARVVSLCGSPNLQAADSQLQYRFGRIGTIELKYPEDMNPRQFAFIEISYVRSWGREVSFSIGDNRYSLRSMSGSSHSGEAEGNNFRGVSVSKNDRELVSLSCVGEVVDTFEDAAFPWNDGKK